VEPAGSSTTPATEQLRVDTRNERISSRELYRRCVRIGDEVIDVAERVVHAVVKET
jgi:hypothetical protein